jgi:hypothetical protein
MCGGLTTNTSKMSILKHINTLNTLQNKSKTMEFKKQLLKKLEDDLTQLCEHKASLNQMDEMTNTGLYWLINGKIEQIKKDIETVKQLEIK